MISKEEPVADPTPPPPVPHDEYVRSKMVEWYHPYLLFLTGLQVLVFDFVGQGRAMEEAARSNHIPSFLGRDELWFDYVADVGDGWDSTFAIASLLARDSLE